MNTKVKLKSSTLDLQSLEIELMDKCGPNGIIKIHPQKYEHAVVLLQEQQQRLLSKNEEEEEDEDEEYAFPDFSLDLFFNDEDGRLECGLEQKKSTPVPLIWMLLALLSHTAWGIYPVLARYLQTTRGLPSMSLLMTGNSFVALITLLIILWRGKLASIIKARLLGLVVIVSAIRATTNLIAPKFTMAIYIQLMSLMTPFMVALLNTVLAKERLPRFTLPAIILCSIGSALMLLSSVTPLRISLSDEDLLGIGLALLSAFFLALYMLIVKRVLTDDSIQGEELLFFLTGPLVLVGGVCSLLLDENWTPWMKLDPTGWAAFILLSGGCLLCGNFLQVSAIQHLGAPMVSTLMAVRLVSSLLFSQIIMDEQFSSSFQFIGAGIVLVSVTIFLWKQQTKKK